jgi:hypothetical protein
VRNVHVEMEETARYKEREKFGRKVSRNDRMGSGVSPWGYAERKQKEKEMVRHTHGVLKRNFI